jgi:hypothetical protein
MPLTEFNGTETHLNRGKNFSTLPIFIGFLLVVMLLSWFLYGAPSHPHRG